MTPTTLPEKEKPLTNQGLKNGAGEEGRTPDLMLASIKSAGGFDETLYKSTRMFPALP